MKPTYLQKLFFNRVQRLVKGLLLLGIQAAGSRLDPELQRFQQRGDHLLHVVSCGLKLTVADDGYAMLPELDYAAQVQAGPGSVSGRVPVLLIESVTDTEYSKPPVRDLVFIRSAQITACVVVPRRHEKFFQSMYVSGIARLGIDTGTDTYSNSSWDTNLLAKGSYQHLPLTHKGQQR
jgi:hypothetical protein